MGRKGASIGLGSGSRMKYFLYGTENEFFTPWIDRFLMEGTFSRKVKE